MYHILASIAISLVFLSLIITSSIKYGTGTYKYCNLTYQGHITRFDTIYLPEDKNKAIVVIMFDVYKLTNGVERFIEAYKCITNLQTSNKYKLTELYANSTIVNLYKNCEYEGPNPSVRYYFSDMQYLQGTSWQSVLAYCIVAFLVSGAISSFCIYDSYFKKPVVIRYTSADFSDPIDMGELSESQRPKVNIFK